MMAELAKGKENLEVELENLTQSYDPDSICLYSLSPSCRDVSNMCT
jgi:hypothetical protein